MFTAFDWLQSMTAIGALELERSRYFFAIDKGLAADFAFELTTTTRIIVDILMRSSTKRANGIFRNRAGFTLLSFDRFDGFAITESVVFVPELPVLFDKGLNDRKLIGKELLVFGTV